MKLSVELEKWRADRPDEWKMDEFIRNAAKIESENDALSQKLRAAQHESEALAAAVEALRTQFSQSLNMLEKYLLSSEHLTGDDASDFAEFQFCLEEAPQQHLRDVRAEAFNDGGSAQKAFWEGFERGAINGAANIRSHWNEYVERVKAGEK